MTQSELNAIAAKEIGELYRLHRPHVGIGSVRVMAAHSRAVDYAHVAIVNRTYDDGDHFQLQYWFGPQLAYVSRIERGTTEADVVRSVFDALNRGA